MAFGLENYTPGSSLAGTDFWQAVMSGRLQPMPGNPNEFYDPASGYAFIPKYHEFEGEHGSTVRNFDGGTLYYLADNLGGDNANLNGRAGYVYDANGNPTDSGFTFQGLHKNAGLNNPLIGSFVPIAAAFGAAAAGLGGAAGGTAAGASSAPVLGSTGALTGTQLGAAGAGAGGGAAGAGGGAAAAGGASMLSQLGGWGSLLAPAAQLIGGALTAHAAGEAADAMSNAAQAGIGEQRREFDTVRELLSPYVTAGNTSLGAYQDLSGANGPDKQRAAMAALEGSPQFGALTKAGENAILQNASATGGLRGGNVQAALADQRTNLLNALTQQQLARYQPIINSGQASAAGVGNAAIATGNNVTNLLGQQGAAQAGGIVAGTSAITNAIGNVGGFFAGQAAGTPASAPIDLRAGMPQGFGSGVVTGFAQPQRLF